MNMTNLRESDYEMKQDGANDDASKIDVKPRLTTASWSRLKDPRIVRVSRAFGGKDRHSKVCTVRGLRDRRVRLAVPTAIQLYDLQDRLGLNQPSKVVDWLLDAAKHEIDELPPLQIPPGCFGPNFQPLLNSSPQERTEGAKMSGSGVNWEDHWSPDKSKVIPRDSSGNHGSNFFERNPNSSSLPGLLNNVVPNSSFLKWDPSNLSLSQFGSYGSVIPYQQDGNVHNFNMNVLYPSPPAQTQSYFPSHNHKYSGEFDPKQLSFPIVSPSSSSNFTQPQYAINQGMKPFQLITNPKFFSSEDSGHEPNEGE